MHLSLRDVRIHYTPFPFRLQYRKAKTANNPIKNAKNNEKEAFGGRCMKKIAVFALIIALCPLFSPRLHGDSDNLILINSAHPLSEEYIILYEDDLTEVAHTRPDGRKMQRMRKEAATALDKMLDDAEKAGCIGLSVTSAYRSREMQKELFCAARDRYLDRGMPYKDAVRMARRYHALPGESEHESGLAADIHNLPAASTTFADTTEYQWLLENAHRYGFILRYPEGKEKVTGIAFEPWHFRYVGHENAEKIHASGLCLEEFLGKK